MTQADLRQYRGLVIELTHLKNRIEELDAQIKRVTPAYSTTPRGGKPADNADNIIKLVELREEYHSRNNTLNDMRGGIERAIDKLADPVERVVLKCRYIDNMRWEDISQLINYERTQTFRIHSRAIKNFEKIKTWD